MRLGSPVTRTTRRLALSVLACLPLLVLTPGTPGADAPEQQPGITLAAETEPSAAPSSESSSEPSSEPSSGPSTQPERPRTRTVTVAISGDILIHDNVWMSAQRLAAREGHSGFDFRPMLADLRPLVSGADLALCHLETPLAPRGGPYSSYPLFSAPPQIADALAWVGYDGCSTASNHTVDQGFAGIVRALDTLDRVGLQHTGSARTPAEAARQVVFDVHGMRIAWLSYTYGTNGMPVDADKPWSVNLIDPARIERDAHRARAAGADVVLVALHWGDEYSTTPSAYQRDLAERLTRDKDITAIYGHHAHVVQPIERLHGTWVVFGLGNLLAGQRTTAPGVDRGEVVVLTLRQRGDGPVRVLRPTRHPTQILEHGPDGEFSVQLLR